MRDALALTEAQLPIADLSRLSEWGRSPDPPLFSIGPQRIMFPSVVFHDLHVWIVDAGLLPDQVELHGDAPARRFIL
eukprot:9021409-Pyramimonas_sp.AAC.1